jgi:hypothetical protein
MRLRNQRTKSGDLLLHNKVSVETHDYASGRERKNHIIPHIKDAKSCVSTEFNTPRTHYGCAIIAPPFSRKRINI